MKPAPSTCFACDAPATSREHAPPSCLFPSRVDVDGQRDLRRNLITVPSCDAHNSTKSKDDEYLLWVLTQNFFGNRASSLQANTTLARSHGRRPQLGNSILASMTRVRVVDRTGQEHEADLARLDKPRFERIMQSIARAIYFRHFGRKWLGPIGVLADFIEYSAKPGVSLTELNSARQVFEQRVARHFEKKTAFGENPEVFYYKVGGSGERQTMRLVFYEGCAVTAAFDPPAYHERSVGRPPLS